MLQFFPGLSLQAMVSVESSSRRTERLALWLWMSRSSDGAQSASTLVRDPSVTDRVCNANVTDLVLYPITNSPHGHSFCKLHRKVFLSFIHIQLFLSLRGTQAVPVIDCVTSSTGVHILRAVSGLAIGSPGRFTSMLYDRALSR